MRLRLPRRHSKSVSITAPVTRLVRAVAWTSFQLFVFTPGAAPSAVTGAGLTEGDGEENGAGVVRLARERVLKGDTKGVGAGVVIVIGG